MNQADQTNPVSPPGRPREPGSQAIILALQEGSRQILAHDDFKETAAVIYRILKKLLGTTAGYVALLSKGGLENDLLFLDAEGLPCAVDRSLPMSIRGLLAEAYQTGRVIYHNDFPRSPWAKFLPREHARLENVLFAPLKIREKTVGLIGLANKPGGFSETDAQTAALFGELAGVALCNSRNLQLLRNSEEHFRAVAQTATDAIVSADSQGLILFWNGRAASLFGYSEAEALGQPVTVIIPDRFQERHCAAMERVRVTGIYHLVGRTLEATGRHRDGHEIPIELSLSEWESGGGVHFTAIIRDITERKKAEVALRQAQSRLEQQVQDRTAELLQVNTRLRVEMEARQAALGALGQSEQKFRAIFNQTFQLIGLLKPDGTVLEVNQATLDFLDLKYQDIIGKHLLQLQKKVPRSLQERVKKGISAAARGKFVRFEIPVSLSPGARQWIDFSIKPVLVLNDPPKVGLLIAEARDISAIKKSELALQESEKRLRLLSSQVLLAQETERKRIAKELHDGVGQYLSAIKYRVENALLGQAVAERPADARGLQSIVPIVQEVIEEIRRICMDLRPSMLDDLGILATIAWFTREFQKTYPGIQIDQDIDLLEDQCPENLKTVIFRIIQESLNNIAKHSEASRVRLKLSRNFHRLDLEIKDNGRGFPVKRVTAKGSEARGLGLPGMRERAELSGGTFQILSKAGQGTQIKVTWPLINADAG
ncbi:MAG: PAS domain S-box protein [Deltaproteobacteria bacterium]|nr:PAS domain S-box protein [Deltaproteobacteria bacterium]